MPASVELLSPAGSTSYWYFLLTGTNDEIRQLCLCVVCTSGHPNTSRHRQGLRRFERLTVLLYMSYDPQQRQPSFLSIVLRIMLARRHSSRTLPISSAFPHESPSRWWRRQHQGCSSQHPTSILIKQPRLRASSVSPPLPHKVSWIYFCMTFCQSARDQQKHDGSL